MVILGYRDKHGRIYLVVIYYQQLINMFSPSLAEERKKEMVS